MSLIYSTAQIPTGPTISGKPNVVELSVVDNAPTYVRGIEVATATLTAGSGLDVLLTIRGVSFRIKSGATASYINGIITITTATLFDSVPPIIYKYFKVTTAAGVSSLVGLTDGEVLTIVNNASANYTAINSANNTVTGTFELAVFDNQGFSAFIKGVQTLQGGTPTTHAVPVCNIDVSQLLHAASEPQLTSLLPNTIVNFVKWYAKAKHEDLSASTAILGPCTTVYGVLPPNRQLEFSVDGNLRCSLRPDMDWEAVTTRPIEVALHQPIYFWVTVFATKTLRLRTDDGSTFVSMDAGAANITYKPWASTAFASTGVDALSYRDGSNTMYEIAIKQRDICQDYQVIYLRNHFGLPEAYVAILKTVKVGSDKLITTGDYPSVTDANNFPVHQTSSQMVEVTDTYTVWINDLTPAMADYIADLLMLGQNAWVVNVIKGEAQPMQPIVINTKSIDRQRNALTERFDVAVEYDLSYPLGQNSGVTIL
jgi:hypothetical protein